MTLQKRLPNLTIRDAQIVFRNFEGRETDFNAKGDRNFSVVFDDPEMVADLQRDGWNVKQMKQRDPDDPLRWHLPVAVSYKNRPPSIWMITEPRRGVKFRTELDEDMLALIDVADIERVDLTLNPYRWHVRDNTGIKAYLVNFFLTVPSNELQLDYAEIPTAEEFRALTEGHRPLEIGPAPHGNVISGEVVSSWVDPEDDRLAGELL